MSGVFFAPLELTPQRDVINRAAAEALDRAGIPMVLLDRDLVSYPERSRYDLVGIDNRRAGYTITRHLIRRGCRRPVFVGRPELRSNGGRPCRWRWEAVAAANLDGAEHICRVRKPDDQAQVKFILIRLRPDGFVCANDFTAAHLLQTRQSAGERSRQVHLVGIDDVKYASLLSVHLSPQSISNVRAWAPPSISAMLDRLRNPASGEDILLNFDLVVRSSCQAPKRNEMGKRFGNDTLNADTSGCVNPDHTKEENLSLQDSLPLPRVR